jgi:hypothetical protein
MIESPTTELMALRAFVAYSNSMAANNPGFLAISREERDAWRAVAKAIVDECRPCYIAARIDDELDK